MSWTQTLVQFFDKNSPAILTGAAVAGVVLVGIFSAKAAVKAHRELVDAGYDYVPWRDKFELQEIVGITWKYFVPPVLIGTATIACILGAQSLNTKRNAAIMSAYSIAEAAAQEYKDKVLETIGENKERKIKEAIRKDKVDATPVSSNNIYITGDGDMLCFDTFTGRYFKSDIEILRKAQNDFNAEIIHTFYGSMNKFYNMIGLDSVIAGEDVGWNTDVLLELEFSSMLTEAGEPCLVMDFLDHPTAKFSNIH